MSQPKTRRVHIMKPVVESPDGDQTALHRDFWTRFHSEFSKIPAKDQFANINGTDFRGAARHCIETSSDYMYLGKTRAKSDWPELRSGDDDEYPLVLEDGNWLVEPCYLYDLGHLSNAVAVLRSSGGPTFTAVENWLTKIYKSDLGNDKITLVPFVREDQLERLERAIAVTKFEVAVMPNQPLSDSDGSASISSALQDAYADAGSSASIEFKLSYGHSVEEALRNRQTFAQFKPLLAWTGLKRASGTFIIEDDAGEIKREFIDFVRDRVTFQIKVGKDSNMAQTPEVVTAALNEAKKKFAELDL